jgi:phosphohistidine phosphatase
MVLRHAKAAGERGGADDFERGLTARGEKEAAAAGREMRKRGWAPDLVLCSSAQRTRDTLRIVLEALRDAAPAAEAIRYEDPLYGASLETLTAFVSACPGDARRVLIVGHNPGLDALLEHLAAAPPPRKANGKLMTTATLACLETEADWAALGQGGAVLAALLRP